MQSPRKRERITVDIGVTVTTVLDSIEATVVDLTEFGAQVVGATLPKGAQFQLDKNGHSVFAVVMWSEIDRMGVRFPFELHDGPLHEALVMARATQSAPAAFRPGGIASFSSGFGRRMAGA